MTFEPFCEQYNKGNVQYPPENRYDAILKECDSYLPLLNTAHKKYIN